MQTFIVIRDTSGNEVRFPVNASVVNAANDPAPFPDSKLKPRVSGGVPSKYSAQFRRYAVRTYLGSSMSLVDCACHLDVPESTLDHWVRSQVGTVRKSA